MISAETIKNWLSEQGRDRAWLADKCNVSKVTVDGWLSANRSIPGPAERIIDQIMNGGVPISPVLDLPTWNRLSEKAKARGVSIETFIEEVLKREASQPD